METSLSKISNNHFVKLNKEILPIILVKQNVAKLNEAPSIADKLMYHDIMMTLTSVFTDN